MTSLIEETLMTIRFAFSILIFLALTALGMASTDIVVDDFEGYASTDDLLEAWTPFNPTMGFFEDNGTILTTDPDEFYGGHLEGQAAEFCGGPQGGSVCGEGLPQGGGSVNRWSTPFSISPSATQNIVLKGDIGDDALAANKRLAIGLRNSSTAQNIIELGFWNAGPIGYSYRAILFETEGEDTGPNWVGFDDEQNIQPLDPSLDITQGVHTFKAVISTDQIEFSLDIFGDGLTNDPLDPQPGVGTEGVDALNVANVTTTAGGFDDLRLGLPSHLPSSGGMAPDGAFAAFDNISLRLVDIPEPTTAALSLVLFIAGLTLYRG